MERKKLFNINDRVIVSAEGGWKQDCKGRIIDGPELIETLEGEDYFYWVQFDRPEEDINGPDKYSKAQILSGYISHTA